MNYGYKTFIALTLATAACFRIKAQNTELQNTDNFMETIDPRTPTADADTTITFEEAQKLQTVAESPEMEENDSIYQSISDIEYEAVRFIAHFENIKMNSYWDKKAKKWTIGFGNTTHPDGRPIRYGDKIKDEAELMYYFRSYFKDRVAPTIQKYIPTWNQLKKNEKIALLDLFWNAGSGQGVLFNKKEDNSDWQKLPEKAKENVAHRLMEGNEKAYINGAEYSFADLPEWRNLSNAEKEILGNLYFNNNIIKGDAVNHSYNEKWQILDGEQRTEVSNLIKQQRDLKLKADMKFNSLSSLANSSFAATAPKPFPLKMPSMHYREVNDSTIRYMGFLASNDYTYDDVPQWYRLDSLSRQKVCQQLASVNLDRGVECSGFGKFTLKDVPAWYLLDNNDKKALENAFSQNPELLHRTRGNQKNATVLTDLGCEINAYALSHNEGVRDRAASRIASFIYSRGKVVSALQKRANIRAKVFTGEITLGGGGANSIDLDKIVIGASYSLNISDLDNTTLICDSINNCKYGKNFADTMEYQLAHATKIPVKKNTRTRSTKRVQNRVPVRNGARGR